MEHEIIPVNLEILDEGVKVESPRTHTIRGNNTRLEMSHGKKILRGAAEAAGMSPSRGI